MLLPITLTTAGALGLVHVWLALRVSLARRAHKVAIGDGGNAALLARARAHGNFAEYAPIFLILLGLVEMARGGPWLWVPATLFVLARLVHPFGMDRPAPNPLRIAGIVVSWLAILALAAFAIAIPYSAPSRPTVTYAALGPA